MTRLELRLAVKLWLDKAGSCMCGFDEDTAAALDVAFIYSLVSKHFGWVPEYLICCCAVIIAI